MGPLQVVPAMVLVEWCYMVLTLAPVESCDLILQTALVDPCDFVSLTAPVELGNSVQEMALLMPQNLVC